jgi:hypothetical protein
MMMTEPKFKNNKIIRNIYNKFNIVLSMFSTPIDVKP